MLESVRQSAINADVLFPSQIEINYRTYRLALSRYFREFKKVNTPFCYSNFSETYFSENGVAWFIHKDVKYFTIVINPGTVVEDRYYGKQIVNFVLNK